MPRYVVQEHIAKKAGRHYDFRLEGLITPGYFDSWVIPKLATPQRCRLAIPVEPHTEGCAYFVGEYGPGYGEGTVTIWDQGTYEIIEQSEDKIKITIAGTVLHGSFTLSKKRDNNWLLIEG